MFPGADYENVFGLAGAVALLRQGTDLLILPIHQAVFGGHVVRLRNAPSRDQAPARPDVRNAAVQKDPGPPPPDVRKVAGDREAAREADRAADRVADRVIDALEFFRQQQLDSEHELRVCAYWNPERSALCVRGLFAYHA
jgi:hypothetical protein